MFTSSIHTSGDDEVERLSPSTTTIIPAAIVNRESKSRKVQVEDLFLNPQAVLRHVDEELLGFPSSTLDVAVCQTREDVTSAINLVWTDEWTADVILKQNKNVPTYVQPDFF